MDILTNQKYIAENILRLRSKILQNEVNNTINDMLNYIKMNNAGVNGAVITAVHSVNLKNNIQEFDFEILMPINDKVPSNEKFNYMEKFVIENALMFRHKGNPQSMNSEIEELAQYIKENKLKPVTPFYNITVKNASDSSEIDEIIADIYVGIEESII